MSESFTHPNGDLLTLIICTYCRPLHVKRLLESLRHQSRQPDEVLVIDGSPDDETQRVTLELRGDNILPCLAYDRVPPEHRGLTRQRNYGIERANGSIIAFLDDDTVPARHYFAAIMACFERHPETAGVGGYLSNEVTWRRVSQRCMPRLSTFCWRSWERREDYRWRLRKLFGLAGSYAPGWIPPFGHGRPIGFLPPDGSDYQVEFIMGGASAWRREVLMKHRFSSYFEGYGLYEDMDFCIRVSRHHPLYQCTSAHVNHYHAPGSRPDAFRLGVMVVRNGWYVWRQRWAQPHLFDRFRWWAITLLLTLCRLSDFTTRSRAKEAILEVLGRTWGMITLLAKRPSLAKAKAP